MAVSEHSKPKRKTQPWLFDLRDTPFFRKDESFEDFSDYCQRFRMGSLLDQTLCCIAHLQKRLRTASFSQVLAGYRYMGWDATPQQVQDSIYALASAKQGSLFHMKLDEGKTLQLRRDVLDCLDKLTYCSPSCALRERFADKG